MDYIDNLKDNIEKAEEHLADIELAIKNNWPFVLDVARTNLTGLLKVTRFCIDCAKRKQEKLGPDKKFKCKGRCVRGVT